MSERFDRTRFLSMTNDPPGLRAGCHINEFRQEGFSRLPEMIALTKPLVLWSPSARLLDEYYAHKISRLSSADLLGYVEKRQVVIVGRRWWLADEDTRDSRPWPYSKWLARFDDRVREIALEDDGKLLSQCRVATMPEETGWEWADQEMSKGSEIVHEADRRLRDRALPPAFLERAKQFPTKSEKIRSVLRDYRDHAMLFQESKCELPIVAWNEPQFLLDPVWHSRADAHQKPTETEERFLGETIKLMLRIGSFPILSQPKILDEFLESKERRELQGWLWESCKRSSELEREHPDQYLRQTLARMIEEGLLKERRNMWDWAIPRSWYQRGIGLLGVSLAVLSVYLGWSDPLTWAGLAAGAAAFGEGPLERAGLKNLTYSGPKWPFLCTIGRSPKYSDFCSLIAKLRR